MALIAVPDDRVRVLSFVDSVGTSLGDPPEHPARKDDWSTRRQTQLRDALSSFLQGFGS